MNLKHLRNTSTVIGLLGLSLLLVAPAKTKALESLEVSTPQISFQQDAETPPMSITFTGWPLHVFLGGTAGLLTLSVMLLIDKVVTDKADKLRQQLQQQTEVCSSSFYTDAIKAANSSYQVWLNLGIALANQNHHEEAITALDMAIALEPFTPDAWEALGDSLSKLMRFQEAWDAFDNQIRAIEYQAKNRIDLLKINEVEILVPPK